MSSSCYKSGPTGWIFVKFYIWTWFENLSKQFKFRCNTTRITNALHEDRYAFVHEAATYRCDDTRGCVMQFWPLDDEHMFSKHVEAWNKLIVKQIFCASRWLIAEINILRCRSTKRQKWLYIELWYGMFYMHQYKQSSRKKSVFDTEV